MVVQQEAFLAPAHVGGGVVLLPDGLAAACLAGHTSLKSQGVSLKSQGATPA